MREERDVHLRWSLRRFLVHFWEDHRRRNDVLWCALTALFIGSLALAFRAPKGAHAKSISSMARPSAAPPTTNPVHDTTRPMIQPLSEPQVDPDTPEAGIEPVHEGTGNSQVQTPAPESKMPSVAISEGSGGSEFVAPSPLAPKGRARQYPLGEITPHMSLVWVSSRPQEPNYTTTLYSFTLAAAPQDSGSPWFVRQPAGGSAARLAAVFQLTAPPTVSSPPPNDAEGGEPSLGDTPPSVGGVNPAPEPGSLTLLLLTSGTLLIHRRRPRSGRGQSTEFRPRTSRKEPRKSGISECIRAPWAV